tara:strand:- start:7285 stop:7656 length:372 start_codon:yes stop_codon:yes gene_type:complete
MKASASFIGRLTRDPESKKVGDTQLTTFALAVNRKVKGGESEPNFFDIDAWGQQGEYITKFAKKGDVVHLDADLKIDKYEDKDGNVRRATKYLCRPYSFGFLPSGAPKDGIAKDSKQSEDVPF